MAVSIKRTSLTDQATEAIIELIAEQGLRDGDPLPGALELSGMLEVSVPVVREALAGLSAIGLIRRQQGRESTVSTPDSSHMSRLFSLRVIGSEIDDESLQAFREIVEVGNARLAARNRTGDDLAQLDEALRVLVAAVGAEQLHEADVAFHAAVARAAHNDLCSLTLDALEPVLHRLRHRVWNGWVSAGGDLRTILDAHEVVLDAIRAGDEEQATVAMAQHLAQARHGLEAKLS